jgi:hypothetical protein
MESKLMYILSHLLVGKPEGKRCGCVDNIKMDLRERGWYVMNWICTTQDRD